MRRGSIHLRRAAVLAAVALVVYYVRFHERHYQRAASAREQVADASSGPIQLAVVWPHREDSTEPDSFIRGINLAVSDVNAKGGVTTYVKDADGNPQLQARQLAVRFFDEQSVGAGVDIARYIATETDVVAVIGHDVSAIPASSIYHTGGVLHVAPTNLYPELTRHGFDNVFSIAPHAKQISLAMVEEVEKIIVKAEIRLAVLYPEGLAQPDVFSSRLNQASERVNPKLKVNFKVFPLLEYPKPSPLQSQSDAEAQKQLDFKTNLRGFVEMADDYDLILIADVLPDATIIRRQLEQEFDSRGNGGGKRVLDFNGLNWARTQNFYTDFSSGNSNELFDHVVELVLEEARQSVAIIASRDAFGETLGATIWSSIYDRMDDPVNRLRMELYRSYFPGRSSTMLITSEVIAKQPDAVFLATTGEEAVDVIRQLRRAGYAGAVMCPPGLEATLRAADKHQAKFEGAQPGKTFVVSPFKPESLGERRSEKVDEFLRRFQMEYDSAEPDWLAATGYFSIELLKFAFDKGSSASPKTAAASMMQFREEDGIFGNVSFLQTARDSGTKTTHDLQGLKMFLNPIGTANNGPP